jgi:hypothetical protein
MSRLVMPHGLDNGATANIGARQSVEMAAEMPFHLSFSLGDEAKTGPVAYQSGQGSDAERARVPQWFEQAGPTPQFLETRFAPGKVIGLLARGIQHEIADFRVAGKHGLGVIQGLGGHLTGMIDAHQCGGLALFIRGQAGIRFLCLASRDWGGRGHRPAGRGGCEQGA